MAGKVANDMYNIVQRCFESALVTLVFAHGRPVQRRLCPVARTKVANYACPIISQKELSTALRKSLSKTTGEG